METTFTVTWRAEEIHLPHSLCRCRNVEPKRWGKKKKTTHEKQESSGDGLRNAVISGVSHQKNWLHWADARVLGAPVGTVVVETFLQDELISREVHVRVGHPPEEWTGHQVRCMCVCECVCVHAVNSRSAQYVDGASQRLVAKQLHVRDRLGHLEGVLLLDALLRFFWMFTHDHHGVAQVLTDGEQGQRKRFLELVNVVLIYFLVPSWSNIFPKHFKMTSKLSCSEFFFSVSSEKLTAFMSLTERSSELCPPHTLQSWYSPSSSRYWWPRNPSFS